jgi:hypothetical protein
MRSINMSRTYFSKMIRHMNWNPVPTSLTNMISLLQIRKIRRNFIFDTLSQLKSVTDMLRDSPVCFREAAAESVCGLRSSNPRPIYPESGARSGVARRLSQVCRVPSVPGRNLHLFREGRQDVLQEGLRQVSAVP